ncbi:MAG: leucine--tRNA ligase [Candidatus Heimdallarchaeota archaeon]|nr:MAG: leucine--tRNA ligase [Candidatus Heimdallarchaeota archaeon]
MSEQQLSIEEFFETLRSVERKWRKLWDEKDIFQAIVDKSKPKFFVTVAYPYASGALHVGHTRTYTLGDLFARFKRQQGYNTLWPMAFHITGTPVLSVSAKIEAGDKKEIEKYTDYVKIYEMNDKKVSEIVKSFVKPMNVAMFFAKHMISDFKAMGYSLDTHRHFTTGDPEYQKFIEWQYSHIIAKNLIVKGEFPILWCLNCKNAVGEDDIKDADIDKVEVQEFVALKFSLGKEYLVAATFRPETIYGATNIWLHPTAIYKRIEIDGEVWIISSEAEKKLRYQNHKIKVLDEFPGSKLIGQEAFAPRVPDRPLPILPATFVDPNHASGVVYSVPAHAPYDYIALRDLQMDPSPLKPYEGLAKKVKELKPIALISLDSYGEFPAVEICERMAVKDQNDVEKLESATQEIYSTEFYNGVMMGNTEEFVGLRVEEAKDKVAETLKAEGRASSFYEVSRKAICRCGGEIIVAVIPDQYFLNYGDTEWKTTAWRALKQMTIVPEKYRRSFESTFNWLDRRPCVRKRGLGTEFPLTKGQGWIIESLSDSVIYMAFYTIIRQVHENEITSDQLIPAVFDFIFLGKENAEKISKKSKINSKLLESMREEFEYWYPNDLRHTAIGHISNHLSFAIFHHAAIFPEKHWLKNFSLNEMLIREGKKMSKSAGNVIPIAHLPKKYSVDVTRLYLVSAGSADTVLNWTEEGVTTLVSRIRKFWAVANSIINNPPTEPLDLETASFMTRAFVSTCHQHLRDAIDQIEAFDGRGYVSHCFHLMLRDVEFYEKTSVGIPTPEKHAALRLIMDPWVIILSPVIPHICEELNQRMGNAEFCSLRLIPSIDVSAEETILNRQMSFINNLIEDIQSIIELKRTNPTSISIYIAPEWKQELYAAARDIVGDDAFNVGKIMGQLKKKPEFSSKMKAIAKELQNIRGDSKIFRQDFLGSYKELEAVKGYKDYMETVFKCPAAVYIAESDDFEDPLNRAPRAQPGKPALSLEL